MDENLANSGMSEPSSGTMQSVATYTMYDIHRLVERALDECVEAGHIIKVPYSRGEVGVEDSIFAFASRADAIKHIAFTIQGELFELELCRRLSPIFRGVARLAKDFQYLDDRGRVIKQLASLRISTEGGKTDV